MKILLMGVSVTGDYDSTMDCDYVVIDADAIKKRTRKLRKIVEKLDEEVEGFSCLELFGTPPEVISQASAIELAGDEVISTMEPSLCESLSVPSFKWDDVIRNRERIEAVVMRVSPDAIRWEFCPKHTTVRLETASLPWEAFD